MSKCWERTKDYAELKQSLTDSLESRGLVEKIYTEKVAEYMSLWVVHQQLQADIRERGVSVCDDRGRISENRSISLALQVSRQMLNLFQALGFHEDMQGGKGAGDDEL